MWAPSPNPPRSNAEKSKRGGVLQGASHTHLFSFDKTLPQTAGKPRTTNPVLLFHLPTPVCQTTSTEQCQNPQLQERSVPVPSERAGFTPFPLPLAFPAPKRACFTLQERISRSIQAAEAGPSLCGERSLPSPRGLCFALRRAAAARC